MNRALHPLFLWLLLGCALFAADSRPSAETTRGGLTWDATRKEFQPSGSEAETTFSFWFTNRLAVPVAITAVRASCGCTVVELPPLPHEVAPGGYGNLPVKMDLRGKHGTVTKSIEVKTTAGEVTLLVWSTTIIPFV